MKYSPFAVAIIVRFVILVLGNISFRLISFDSSREYWIAIESYETETELDKIIQNILIPFCSWDSLHFLSIAKVSSNSPKKLKGFLPKKE